MAKLARRKFLGHAALVASAAGCRPLRDPYSVDKPQVPLASNLRPGTEQRVLSTCGICAGGCGIRVRVVDGRAVKVEGNPESPINRGRLCARGQAALEVLYHAARVGGPLQRTGARGDEHWRQVPWDEAIAAVAAELGKLRTGGEAHGLVLIDGTESDTTHALWARFLAAFGSPNHFDHGATGAGALRRAMSAATGVPALPGYDFEHARLVVLVGTGALESSPQSMALARAMASNQRPRVVCAWPRLSPSGLVDQWLPLAPQAEAAFLLALAHVLLREGLADESLLARARGFGRPDHAGRRLRDLIVSDFAPEKLEARLGLPAAAIEKLARELGAQRPSLVAVDDAVGDDAAVAAIVLNALLGSFGGPGGMMPDDGAGSAFAGAAAVTASSMVALDGRPRGAGVEASRLLALPEAILAGTPYPTKALLLYYSNPVFSKPGGEGWRKAIAKVPLVVSFSPLLDESARFSDWVLPDTTFLERWDVIVPGRGTRVLSLRQPVVEPVDKAMATGEVVLRLAGALGSEVGAAFPWPSYRDAVFARLGKAAQVSELASALARDGVIVRSVEDTRPRDRASTRLSIRSVADAPPGGPEPEPDAALFPFVLLPFRGPGYGEGGSRHLPWLAELPLAGGGSSETMVEMSPEDARALGIRDREGVLVESAVGQLRARVRIHEGIREGVLGLSLGGGSWPPGSEDANPMRLLRAVSNPQTGHWYAGRTRARLRRC